MNYDQQHKLLQFLLGLNDRYLHVRSQILLMNLLPTVGQAFSLVSQEESHRSLYAVSSPALCFILHNYELMILKDLRFNVNTVTGMGTLRRVVTS